MKFARAHIAVEMYTLTCGDNHVLRDGQMFDCYLWSNVQGYRLEVRKVDGNDPWCRPIRKRSLEHIRQVGVLPLRWY